MDVSLTHQQLFEQGEPVSILHLCHCSSHAERFSLKQHFQNLLCEFTRWPSSPGPWGTLHTTEFEAPGASGTRIGWIYTRLGKVYILVPECLFRTGCKGVACQNPAERAARRPGHSPANDPPSRPWPGSGMSHSPP